MVAYLSNFVRKITAFVQNEQVKPCFYLKGGSNNSEIGICALSEVYFWKFVREHSGLCDRTNFQKDTFESVQITFQNSRTLKTEFLEPPFTQYPRWESNSDHCFRRAVFYPLNYEGSVFSECKVNVFLQSRRLTVSPFWGKNVAKSFLTITSRYIHIGFFLQGALYPDINK